MAERKFLSQGLDFDMNPVSFSYTGSYQTFTAPFTGYYRIQLWGSSGYSSYGGMGSYVSGDIKLKKGQVLYVYLGGNTTDFNGSKKGGSWGNRSGGSSDISLISGEWNNEDRLKSRIIVAAGASSGGTFYEASNIGPNAGGLIGEDSVTINNINPGTYRNTGATQTRGGQVGVEHEPGYPGVFGSGGACYNNSIGSGGGGGYYGGAGGGANPGAPESGSTGSCFISGHDGCDAIDSSGAHTGQSIHYSNMKFINTEMIDGSGYKWTTSKQGLELMPNPSGGYYSSGKGHNSTGYCIISKA